MHRKVEKKDLATKDEGKGSWQASRERIVCVLFLYWPPFSLFPFGQQYLTCPPGTLLASLPLDQFALCSAVIRRVKRENGRLPPKCALSMHSDWFLADEQQSI
jgi:hypothetical protein